MTERENAAGREFAEQVLRQVVEALSHPELLIEGAATFVDGWVEEGTDGVAVRVVYDYTDADRRLGFRWRVEADDGAEDSREMGSEIADVIDEPLGRQWDLLVEESGVWWWGHGYPGLDQHPDTPALQEYMEAEVAHWLHGAPAPTFPFAPDLPPGATFEITPVDPSDGDID